MPAEDTEFWVRAYQARDKLVDQFLDHPEVSLIDLGYDLASDRATGQIVLRVHLRRPATRQALGLPEQIDGIPVRVVAGDYRLE